MGPSVRELTDSGGRCITNLLNEGRRKACLTGRPAPRSDATSIRSSGSPDRPNPLRPMWRVCCQKCCCRQPGSSALSLQCWSDVVESTKQTVLDLVQLTDLSLQVLKSSKAVRWFQDILSDHERGVEVCSSARLQALTRNLGLARDQNSKWALQAAARSGWCLDL